MIKKVRIKVTTTGVAGSATGTGTSDEIAQGFVVGVAVNYHTSAPATTDLTLTEASELVSTNILTRSNTATDIVLYPTVQLTDNAGAGLTYDGTRVRSGYYPVSDYLKVTLAQCDALTNAVVVDVYVLES